MKKHILKFREVDRDKFEQIRTGEKSIETRAATPKFTAVEVGDFLDIRCGSDSQIKSVKAITHFDSVESLFRSADFGSVLPGVTTLDEAEKVFYGFPGYEEKIAEHGFVAFYLE